MTILDTSIISRKSVGVVDVVDQEREYAEENEVFESEEEQGVTDSCLLESLGVGVEREFSVHHEHPSLRVSLFLVLDFTKFGGMLRVRKRYLNA